MRLMLPALSLSLLAGCAGPLPPVDPNMAWVDLHTFTGKTLMADKLDGKRTDDGRYFQVTPGKHELQIRYDYEYRQGGLGMMVDNYSELTCYLRVEYDHFEAGKRYRLEVRHLANDINAWLQDEQRQNVAEENPDIFCIP